MADHDQVSGVEISYAEAEALALRHAVELPAGSIVVVVPDSTRSGTDYVGAILRGIYRAVADRATSFTALIALGTHTPMTHEKICATFGFTDEELRTTFPKLVWANHEWKDPAKLTTIGTFTREDMLRISGGKFDLASVRHANGFPIEINHRIPEADAVVIVGPVLNHEVVGKSGGNKYFFPGTSGPKGTQFTHWLGACITIPNIMGIEWTPVRDAIDFMASHITKPVKRCFALVLNGRSLAHLAYGTPEMAHHEAAIRIDEYQTRFVDEPYKTVIAVISKKYPEIWTGGKGSYKLQGIVADGGELILYAPHLTAISAVWGEMIEQVGYHTLPYIQARLDEYLDRGVPLGVLAHVTHVMCTGTYENGVESPGIRISLASQLSREQCERLNLGYLDPDWVDVEGARSEANTLVVDDAGEVLYRLRP